MQAASVSSAFHRSPDEDNGRFCQRFSSMYFVGSTFLSPCMLVLGWKNDQGSIRGDLEPRQSLSQAHLATTSRQSKDSREDRIKKRRVNSDLCKGQGKPFFGFCPAMPPQVPDSNSPLLLWRLSWRIPVFPYKYTKLVPAFIRALLSLQFGNQCNSKSARENQQLRKWVVFSPITCRWIFRSLKNSTLCLHLLHHMRS